MSEEDEEQDLHPCQQCAMLYESLQPCEGECGREICSSCGPKCKECTDRERVERWKREEEEKKKQKAEEVRKFYRPDRNLVETVDNLFDWVFCSAYTALIRDVERYPGELDGHEPDEIKEIIRKRWKYVPEWKKALYKAKKTGEKIAIKTAVKGVMAFGNIFESMKKRGR